MGSVRGSSLALWLAACGPTVATGSGDADTSSSGTSASTTIASTTDVSTSSTTSTTATGELDTTTSEPPTLDVPGCPPLSCGGYVYACTDGEDNDADGFVDLQDPGCISVCDDDEVAFSSQVGWGNFDCNWDCLFDGNSGQGDDECLNRLGCDPESPGELIGCAYPGHMNEPPSCADWPEPLSEMCREFCQPFVLPGCDCFGCCTITTDDGPIDVWLDSSTDCSLENLAACQPCTSRIEECGNVCGGCEICIGQSEPIDGCRENFCENGERCSTQDDCACGEMCILGCCLPLPPG